ncbi:MAG: class I adenylate-forming enzyme family protein [Pseudomonadota bacterium]
MNLVEPLARQALAIAKQPALVASELTISYGGLMQRVARAASQLTQAGIRRGDIVGITANTFVPQIMLPLAIAWIGAISIPISRRNVGMARGFGVKLIVHHLNGLTMPETSGVPALSLAELNKLDDGSEVPIALMEPQDIWRIAMSSGTTGRPKAISYSHSSAIMRAQLSRIIYPGETPERLMIFMGLELTFSCSYWMRALFNGGVVVRQGEGFAETMDLLRKENVTLLVTSPNNAIRLVEVAKKEGSPYKERPPALRTLCVGGAVVVPGVQQSLRQYLCPNLGINYGSTETGAVAVLDEEVQRQRPGSAGRLLPWVEARVLGDDGELLPFGKVGRIAIRSPGLATAYVHPAGEAAPQLDEAFEGGWFKTADRGAISKDGLVFLAGRGGEVINLGGHKVDASVVEEAIARDPAVTECAVLAMQNESGEQLMVALVVSDVRVEGAAVRKRCREVLGRTMVPAAVFQVDALPRNDGGKVIRKELAALAREASATRTQAKSAA